ncbi:MAG: ATP-binding protein, partial [Candidatus Nanoarchaeia archaeon]
AKDLSRRLLLFARKEKPEKLVFDVNLIIQDTEKMLKHTLRPDILQEFNLSSEESILINADKSQIEQVIMNLVVNAQDAMPQGGKITIETRKTILDHKEAEKLGVPPGAFVVISVSDIGIGMSQNTLQQIFEPYFTTKKAGQGTGLGLPISYSIIKDHGGAIKVESKLGRGSKFEVYLPIAEYKEKRSDEAPNLENYEGTGNILLVDDDNETLRFTKKFLERLGYNVRDFSNPVAALEYAKSTNKLPESLLITDLTMPRIGGKELAIKIKEKHPTIKIIFISGYATENLEEYLSIGSAFISKPFNLNETAKKIRDVLTA